ncbi:UvrABC system protein C [Elstera cyanobacteriorum]|uniref:UvrABC system protein C n=1 Tax=Elstera cyanobacteriorum TaxID=2022747 RepID=A0A255XQ25_9PROT|nr:excinuclease ABC subunit UvrC [Elstera cyanobacteriorum]OYQ18971.1 excinuclease ABC subunit C [Elstera cyanobacteriorum]GFZ76544.1 UvrABC system protein C [Elstera cyanobacteriorum]
MSTPTPPENHTIVVPTARPPVSFDRGAGVIARVVETLPLSPGVYRMLSFDGDVLYVGKARQLKRRVANYTNANGLPVRIRRMVAETASMEIITTHTEVEALLLEANLIKKLLPRYNVLLRDDKSFLNIFITGDHAYPQLTKHRGARNRKGDYFGPFASAGAVERTVQALQRIFLLRTCSDTIFSGRTRPCLQYQIKRCCAPCVGKVSETEYGDLIDSAKSVLLGRSRDIHEKLTQQMQAAAEILDYEAAAKFRDRIRALATILQRQDINTLDFADADVFALAQIGGQSCLQVFFFRNGSNYGNHAYYPAHDDQATPGEILASFIAQFYDERLPPPLLLLSDPVEEEGWLAEALSVKAERKVSIQVPKRGSKADVVKHAVTNAKDALERRLAEKATQRSLLDQVARIFALPAPPQRIEVYDNSHIQGTNAIGAMIVAGPDGFQKNAYRTWTIKGEDLTPGDDFGMMKEVLTRRFSRALKEDPDRQGGSWPDLVVIDGGAGQLGAAVAVMEAVGVADLPLVCIAKGQDRESGREDFYLPGKTPFKLPPQDPALYYIQRLRDEAHRFAIGTHRAKRQKAQIKSELDEVPGIGPNRRKALLHHFGSVRAITRAGLSDLEQVPGISKTVAKKIYDHFHGGS